MPNILYCAHCDGALIHRRVEGSDIYMCPMCSAIYEKVGDNYKYLCTLSGGISIKEMLNNLASV